jgi:hypothetical protein
MERRVRVAGRAPSTGNGRTPRARLWGERRLAVLSGKRRAKRAVFRRAGVSHSPSTHYDKQLRGRRVSSKSRLPLYRIRRGPGGRLRCIFGPRRKLYLYLYLYLYL